MLACRTSPVLLLGELGKSLKASISLKYSRRKAAFFPYQRSRVNFSIRSGFRYELPSRPCQIYGALPSVVLLTFELSRRFLSSIEPSIPRLREPPQTWIAVHTKLDWPRPKLSGQGAEICRKLTRQGTIQLHPGTHQSGCSPCCACSTLPSMWTEVALPATA